MTKRNRAVLCGLFLSKWDQQGLRTLGFSTFAEAYNILGLAFGVRPLSVKNYRDEFDPVLSKVRKGRHKRPMRSYCELIYEKYKNYEMEEVVAIIGKFTGIDFSLPEGSAEEDNAYAKRLLTGVAAENYFLINRQKEEAFRRGSLRDMTKMGCGYDFSIVPESGVDFIAIEVKGLNGKSGGISVTEKEHAVANALKDRFYLYVVLNLDTVPSSAWYRNPLASTLEFKMAERSVKQVTWNTRI